MSRGHRLTGILMMVLVVTIASAAQVPKGKLGYDDTPMLPGGTWRVHDGTRPQPPAIQAAGTAGAAPSDAQLLFGGADLSRWQNRSGQPVAWKIDQGAMVVAPGAGDIITRDEFGDVQLHVEWASPSVVSGDGQDRGNSGVFLMGRYEVQVLDSYRSPTYPDGQAAAIYGQYPPLVNVARPPGEWQFYDILFTAPRFENGAVVTPAYLTVFHNGVAVHNHTALIGTTLHKVVGKYEPHGLRGPIRLQDHRNPVRYRNIWVRELGGYDRR